MTNQNLNKTEHQKQGGNCPHCLGIGKVAVSALEDCPWCNHHTKTPTEPLLSEIKAFLSLLLITPVSLKETSEMIMKIEKWEAAK